MRFVLLPLGTWGDLLPFLEIGQALRHRGHQVLVATAEDYRQPIEARGLSFEPVLSRHQQQRFLTAPGLWQRRRFFGCIAKELMVPATAPIVQLVSRLPQPQSLTLVAAYCASPGARLAAELTGARHISVWPQPAAIQSPESPPLVCGLEWLSRLPRWGRRLGYWLLNRLADGLLAGPINRLRAQYGQAPVGSILKWMVSAYRSLCLFPPWYCRPQRDWPRDSRTVGFIQPQPQPLDPQLLEYLQAGPPPLVVTAGTGVLQLPQTFLTSVQAGLSQGLRVLLIGSRQLAWPALPTGCQPCCTQPDFASLLPRVRALVHHGGVGTVAAALRAGIPQLVLPQAHDQPDNAGRVARLGAGLSLSPGSHSIQSLQRALQGVLSPERLQNCRKLAQAEALESGLERACFALEQP